VIPCDGINFNDTEVNGESAEITLKGNVEEGTGLGGMSMVLQGSNSHMYLELPVGETFNTQLATTISVWFKLGPAGASDNFVYIYFLGSATSGVEAAITSSGNLRFTKSLQAITYDIEVSEISQHFETVNNKFRAVNHHHYFVYSLISQICQYQ